MPARAPASIDMLQTVMRSSIDSALDPGAAVLDHVAGTAIDPDPADDGEHQVLGGNARRQPARHVDRERARPALQQALGREHVTDLRGADAEGERTEGTVGAGVAVAADDRASGLGEPELGADDVHDATPVVAHAEQLDAELATVVFELAHLACGRLDRDRHAGRATCAGSVGVE